MHNNLESVYWEVLLSQPQVPHSLPPSIHPVSLWEECVSSLRCTHNHTSSLCIAAQAVSALRQGVLHSSGRHALLHSPLNWNYAWKLDNLINLLIVSCKSSSSFLVANNISFLCQNTLKWLSFKSIPVKRLCILSLSFCTIRSSQIMQIFYSYYMRWRKLKVCHMQQIKCSLPTLEIGCVFYCL